MCECKGDYVCSWHKGLKDQPMLPALPKAEAERIRSKDESAWGRLCEKYTSFGQNGEDKAQGWIQWKGTSVCMDLHCVCGHCGHVDGDFTYLIRCKECRRVYWPQAWVNMKELTGDDLKDAEDAENIHESD